MCTVFAVYDMCKDELANYEGLTGRASRQTFSSIGDARGAVQIGGDGMPYWSIAGADVKKGVDAKSVLAEAMLRRMEEEGTQGIISFPESWIGFQEGKPDHAKGAEPFKTRWVSRMKRLNLIHFDI